FVRKTVEGLRVRRELFEQCVARADAVHVTLEQWQVAGLRLRKEQIQKAPARAARAFDELQIFRAKNHRAQRAEVVTEFFNRPAIEGKIPFSRGPIHFDFTLGLADDFSTSEITLLAVANHLRAANAAERTQRGHEV